MASITSEFADYCCELLQAAGPCVARRMFGGWGISTGGLTIALVADLGDGERLWLKADADSRQRFEAAGCRRFSYLAKGKPLSAARQSEGTPMSLNYYSAPEEALESPQLMAPWARQALDCALKARAAKAPRPRGTTKSVATPTSPKTRRPTAPAPRTSAKRRSASG